MRRKKLQQARLRELLRQFKEEHAEEYQLRALGYFGSYARGEATDDSDVDIVFDTRAPNLYKAVCMRLDLEEHLGLQVDLLQVGGIQNKRLKARVEREAVYI